MNDLKHDSLDTKKVPAEALSAAGLAAPYGYAATCEMERISREGKCGKPASGFWIHDDGKKTAVCDMCALSVMVNGGKLEAA